MTNFPDAPSSLQGTAIASPRVLVIEDDQDITELLKHHLTQLECNVDIALTGEEGLQKAFRNPPDMVIIDVLLPGIDGREVIRRLRNDERTKHCHLVVSSVLDAEDLVDLAAEQLLVKPFRRSSVSRVINAYRDDQR